MEIVLTRWWGRRWRKIPTKNLPCPSTQEVESNLPHKLTLKCQKCQNKDMSRRSGWSSSSVNQPTNQSLSSQFSFQFTLIFEHQFVCPMCQFVQESWRHGWSHCMRFDKQIVTLCLLIPGHFDFWAPVRLHNASLCVTFICTMHRGLSLCAKLAKRKKRLHKVDICEKSNIWAQSGHTNWRTEWNQRGCNQYGHCGQHGNVQTSWPHGWSQCFSLKFRFDIWKQKWPWCRTNLF